MHARQQKNSNDVERGRMIEFERLGYTEQVAEQFERTGLADYVPGRVTSLDRGYPLVNTAVCELRAELATTIKKRADSIVAVGDWVALRIEPGHEKAIIAEVLPRRTELARVKRVGREKQVQRQVLAANVDTVFVCHSLTGAGLDERLALRQIVAVYGCGALPVVVLTKGDLVDDAAATRAAAAIHAVFDEVEVVITASSDPDCPGAARVRELCRPSTTAMLLGESGVGKSTLVNSLLGQEELATGAVRASDDKGRHTTVARRMLEVPGGGLIIDAPGLRTLQILDIEASLQAAFGDIVSAAAECKFSNCSHTHEPGCAVRERVRAERLETYLALQERR